MTEVYEPSDYGMRAIKFMLGQGCGGLFLDPGLGKTAISLAASKVLLGKQMVKGVLVVAPLRTIYSTWPNEMAKWDAFEGMTHTILHGKGKDDLFSGPPRDVYLINPEGVVWLVSELMKQPPAEWPFDMLIVDESTKFKKPSTHRFKALKQILQCFKRRYILTGTPTPNGLLDLFGQLFILDMGHSLGRYITHFRNTFFYPSGYGGYTWTPMPDALERITERVAPLTLRMTREEYLNLPPLVNTYAWLELPDKSRRIYRDLQEEFLAEIGVDELVIAPNAAAAGIKCRQMLNGAMYTGIGREWKEFHDTKVEALVDLVEELSGAPLLVFYEFQHDRDRLLKRLPNWHALGLQNPKKDAELLERFNRGELPGLLAHPASAGHGLNLQETCMHICWFGLTWNFEHYDQAIQRVWRQGQKNKVINHHLCIRDSLDEVVIETLESKDGVQTSFQEGIQAWRKKNIQT
jgi:SNF2 family DNA or RNA helicase